ncbi:MAG: phosphonopyruvate decarboxylase [Candidatus Excrementavichristensenella sp.]|jgi:phosphonopyruvate decarboxylase
MELDFLREFEFFTGVPDSQLKPLCDHLMARCGISTRHIIAVNEGNAVALAAGYHLATGKVPVVYLQNSGIGNIINPVASLMHPKVYGIPCLFIIGWRGEPGVHDEPQHIFQGEVTLKLLEDMDVKTFVIGKETAREEAEQALDAFRPLLAAGGQAAFVVRKGALKPGDVVSYRNGYSMSREEAIRQVVRAAGEDLIVSTTGKASRELFEIREALGQGHGRDFLTVGSMGHASSIALGLALNCPERRVWIVDGDGAALMHLGAMALLGNNAPENVVHVVINNGAHESVGGMPTVAGSIDLLQIARGCGYRNACSADSPASLSEALGAAARRKALSLVEAKCAIGAREDLGRPTATAMDNKRAFMENIRCREH